MMIDFGSLAVALIGILLVFHGLRRSQSPELITFIGGAFYLIALFVIALHSFTPGP